MPRNSQPLGGLCCRTRGDAPIFGGIVTTCAAHALEPRFVVRLSRRPASRLDRLSLKLQRRFRANTRRHAAALRSRNRAYRLRSALPRRDAFAFGRRAASSSSIAVASAVSRASSLSPFVSSTKATSFWPAYAPPRESGAVCAARRRAERWDCLFRSRPDGCTTNMEVHDRHRTWRRVRPRLSSCRVHQTRHESRRCVKDEARLWEVPRAGRSVSAGRTRRTRP